MNIQIFRDDLRAFMQSKNLSQTALSEKSGVTQSSLSRFLAGSGISGENTVLLCSIIYGLTPALPATPPAAEPPVEATDAAAPVPRRRGRPRRRPDGMPATEGGEDSGRSGEPGCDAGAA